MENFEPRDQRRSDLPRDGSANGAAYDDEISLKRLVRTLWSYRRVIVTTIATVVVVFAIGAAVAFLRQPVERQASVEFRLMFDGADRGEYPNGLRFSRSEIIASPVLLEVYEANELGRYCTFDEFKNGFFIMESNRDLELLQYEYAAKLADTRLATVDRARLEQEFGQRREALKVAQYRLNLMNPGGRAEMPNALMSKVLNDVLATWAEQADRRGVLKYQINVLTANILSQDFMAAEDYVIRLDILRGKINRILQNLDELAELPGATIQRVGETRVSLAEVRANLLDVLRFKAEPVTGQIRATAISTNSALLSRYLENRLFQVRLDKEEAQARVSLLQDSLRRYMSERGGGIPTTPEGTPPTGGQGSPLPGATALIPQFGESFIDRLVELSSQNNDVRYRQELTDRMIDAGQVAVGLEKESAYYESLLDSVRRPPTAGAGNAAQAESARLIDSKLDEIYAATMRAVEQANAVYEQLSKHNLNPRTSLYAMTGPYSVTTQRAITLRGLATYALLTIVVATILVPLACLVHNYFRQEGLLSARGEGRGGRPAEAAVAGAQERRQSARAETAAPIME
jgi:hypothetical protein